MRCKCLLEKKWQRQKRPIVRNNHVKIQIVRKLRTKMSKTGTIEGEKVDEHNGIINDVSDIRISFDGEGNKH